MLGHCPKVPVATSYTYSLFDEYTFVCICNMWYEIALKRGHITAKNVNNVKGRLKK